MSLRLISAILLALALFVVPVARMGAAGPVMAAEMPPTDGHCGEERHPADDGKSRPYMSCASACAALHATLPTIHRQVEAAAVTAPSVMRAVLTGISTEAETPPPRG
jgi:hypothetical protein